MGSSPAPSAGVQQPPPPNFIGGATRNPPTSTPNWWLGGGNPNYNPGSAGFAQMLATVQGVPGGPGVQGGGGVPASQYFADPLAGGNYYTGPGIWGSQTNPGMIPSGMMGNQEGMLYFGQGQNNAVAPQNSQPQALLDAMRAWRQPGASMGRGGPGTPGTGAFGSMGTYPGGVQGANQWWGANGRPWGM